MQKVFKRLGAICFTLMWIPFILIMVNLSSIGENPEMVYGIPKQISLWVILTVGLSLAGFIFLIAGLISGSMANRKILNEGQPAQAKILSVQDSGTRINDYPVLLFSLEVKSPEGIFNAQAQKLVSIFDVASYQPEKMIEVKYLPGTQKVAIV